MFEDTLTVRYYTRPNGRMRELDIINIYSEKVQCMEIHNE